MRLALSTLLLLLLALTPARADDDAEKQAVRLLTDGADLFHQGDFARAREKFLAAHHLVPGRVNPLRWLGLSEARLGHCLESVRYLREFLDRVATTDPRRAEAEAVQSACQQELTARSGSLEVTSIPEGAEIRLDEASNPASGKTPVRIDNLQPGNHAIFLLKPGFEPLSQNVTIEKGQVARLSMQLLLTAAPASQPTNKKSNKKVILAAVLTSVAVAAGIGLGVGLGLGLRSESEYSPGKATVLPPITLNP